MGLRDNVGRQIDGQRFKRHSGKPSRLDKVQGIQS
jgi:hypothetical protein